MFHGVFIDMKIIITKKQYNVLNENLSDDQIFRKTIKGYESTVVDKSGSHYVFDDKDPKTPKTFIKSAKDKKGGTLTIGWGHTGDNAKLGNKIPNAKAENLLSQDITTVENRAKRLFPKYGNYPLYLQRALVNCLYRGEAKSSYEWVKSIISDDWDKASKKYLEGWDINFKQASDPRYKGGVADRMVTNQKAFKKYADEIKANPSILKKNTKDKPQNLKSQNEIPNNSSKPKENINNIYKVGTKIYPKKTADSDYANVRTSTEVNTGFINNLITAVYYPKLIGVIEKTQKDNTGKMWYYVKLADGLSWYYNHGWVRFDVVTN